MKAAFKIVTIIFLLSSTLTTSASAAGLISLLERYVVTVDTRLAYQELLETGRRTSNDFCLNDRIQALKGREQRLAKELKSVQDERDDIAEIVSRKLRKILDSCDIEVIAACYPTRARVIKSFRKAIGTGDYKVFLPLLKARKANTKPCGAIVKSAPRFSSSIVELLDGNEAIEILGRSASFLQLESGWVHEALVKIEATDRWFWNTNIDPELDQFDKIHDQKPSYYYTPNEKGFPVKGYLYGHYYTGNERRRIRSPNGHVIAETSGRFFACLCMQGSGLINDGRGVSYVSNKRFSIMPEGCKGVTATGYWVVPFHTLAVNRKEMPYRGVYYAPKTRGMRMPNGEKHDGYWFAHDTGGAFQGTPRHRIDMYVARKDWVMWMEENFVPSKTPIEMYRVDSGTKKKVYEKYKEDLGKRDPIEPQKHQEASSECKTRKSFESN